MAWLQASSHELYWTVGDGGPQNDPDNKAQDRTAYHGSMVRISVPSTTGGTGYDIPLGNAFDGTGGKFASSSSRSNGNE